MPDANFKQRQDSRAVLLSITGAQKDALGEEERIEFITKGQLYEKSGVSYITYKESAGYGSEPGAPDSSTMLKLCPDYMLLCRSGHITQRQEFRPGRLCASAYITPYGSFDMAVMTNSLRVSRSEYGKVSGLDVEYELHLDGHWQSTNTLSITINEDLIQVGC